MESRVAKNYIYNLIYQIAMLIIPLITAPYLARILGPEGTGVYSYNYSIAYYFCLFVMLGINNYGNRSIAKCLGNQNKINKTFCEIYAMQLACGMIVLCAYVVYSLFICREKLTALCYIPLVFSYILDVNWLFFGQENFKIILVRNVLIKILTTVAIFGLIKGPSDVILYILILSFGALVNQLVVWIIVIKKIKFVRVKIKDIIPHILPNLVLFIPVVAVSIYRTMDKIMLGSMANMIQVGYYENAEKIVSILLSFITALGTVMLPRMSALYERGDSNQINRMLCNSFVFVAVASSIIAFGISSIADTLVVVYYGNNYVASGVILQLLCITVPLISFANIVRMQILVPQEKDKAYVISCIAGAAVNLVINVLLIPSIQAVGAAIGTIAAELTVLIIQLTSVKEKPQLGNNKRSILLFGMDGIVMFVCVRMISSIMANSIFSLLIEIAIGAIVFGLMLIIQWKVFKDNCVGLIIQSVSTRFLHRKVN